MDLIYTNADREDLGVLLDYEFDLAFGESENDFECTIQSNAHCCTAGSYLYIEGTEYGGIVDNIQSKSDTKEVVYAGRTWHGILASKIIVPLLASETSTSKVTLKTTDANGNSLVNRYLILSGDANACIQFLLSRLGLSSMFAAPSEVSGVTINKFQFDRYTDAYKGIVKMLSSAGAKLRLVYTGGLVNLSAAPKYDYAQDEEFDTDLVGLDVKKSYNTVNHLICLGTGDLEDRMVVHLYADKSGNISRTQTQFGVAEYVAIYDYSNVESEEELVSAGTDKLKGLWQQDKISIDLDEAMDTYDVGDVVGASDNVTGMQAAATITKKVVTIKNGQITVDLSTDTMSSSGGNASGNGTSGDSVLEKAYPVGSVYMSTAAANPKDLFGFGTWEQVKDTFLLAAGDSYAAGTTGGEAAHTLTVAELPSHSHTYTPRVDWSDNAGWGIPASFASGKNLSVDKSITNYTATSGSGQAHNNMPPYLAVYVWKRTA